MVFVRDF